MTVARSCNLKTKRNVVNLAFHLLSQCCALRNAVERRVWRDSEVSDNPVEVIFVVDFAFRRHLECCPKRDDFAITGDALTCEDQISRSYAPVGAIENESPARTRL